MPVAAIVDDYFLSFTQDFSCDLSFGQRRNYSFSFVVEPGLEAFDVRCGQIALLSSEQEFVMSRNFSALGGHPNVVQVRRQKEQGEFVGLKPWKYIRRN